MTSATISILRYLEFRGNYQQLDSDVLLLLQNFNGISLNRFRDNWP